MKTIRLVVILFSWSHIQFIDWWMDFYFSLLWYETQHQKNKQQNPLTSTHPSLSTWTFAMYCSTRNLVGDLSIPPDLTPHSGEVSWTQMPRVWHYIRLLMWPHVPPLTCRRALLHSCHVSDNWKWRRRLSTNRHHTVQSARPWIWSVCEHVI